MRFLFYNFNAYTIFFLLHCRKLFNFNSSDDFRDAPRLFERELKK